MTRKLYAAALAFLPVMAGSCHGLTERETLPPEGQIVLAMTTDAWLPRGAGEAREEYEPMPLFERLRIELFAPNESEPCRDCLRDFGIDSKTVNEGRASIGFVPKVGVSGYRARVRVYHTGPSESYAEPRPRATIETVVRLPAIGGEGITLLHVVLHTDNLGRPEGTLEAPVDPALGPPPPNLANTWHAEVRHGCASPAAEGEACVPGGAFWMGDPSFDVPYERLVAVSPFLIDTHEVTVGELRASGVAKPNAFGFSDSTLTSTDASKVATAHCTYTQDKGITEDLPVNCISRQLARDYCAKIGRRLPTEAEHEFVSGARVDAVFPWGDTTPECGDAVYGRDFDQTKPPEWRLCASLGTHVAKPGSGKLDRVKLSEGSAEIVDLVANLSEHVEDTYNDVTEPCIEENPAVDPVCRQRSASKPSSFLLRGGSWDSPGSSNLRAAGRFSGQVEQTIQIGFRCARDGNF